MKVALILIAIIIIVFLFYKFYSSHKTIKCNSCLMITGAPKTGKSLLSVYLSYQFLTKNRILFFLKKSLNIIFLNKLKNNIKPMPEFYSNIPLNVPFGYIPVSKSHLLRDLKIIDKSVVYLGEFSLVANSKTGLSKSKENDLINEQLLLFTKLCGHEWNGNLVVDSQTISDVHYSMKRVLSNYLYIHHSINLLFHKILFVREMIYSDDNNSINTSNEDLDSSLKWLLVPKYKYYKMYDYRCYSSFTDNLDIDSNVINNFHDKKAKNIVSFVDFKNLVKEKGDDLNE